MRLPADPTLAAVAAEYEASGACSIVRDDEGFLVYATSEYMRWDDRRLVPTDPAQHWFGPEVTEYMRQAFGRGHSRRHEFLFAGPWVLFHTRGGRDVLRARVDASLVDLVDDIEPVRMPMIWSGNHADGTGTDLPSFGERSDISITTTRVDDAAGRCVGSLTDYRPAAGMSQVFSALQLADLRHVERMNAVARPGRRPGAILFADLEASTPLSKRMSTAQYFAFGRRMVRGIDQCLIDHGGIVGRHAGDGAPGSSWPRPLGRNRRRPGRASARRGRCPVRSQRRSSAAIWATSRCRSGSGFTGAPVSTSGRSRRQVAAK